MALEKIEVEVAKESNDVLKLILEAVKLFKAGKSWQDMGELLDELMGAIQGADQIPQEYKDNAGSVYRAGGLFLADLGEVLAAPKEEAPADPAPAPAE